MFRKLLPVSSRCFVNSFQQVFVRHGLVRFASSQVIRNTLKSLHSRKTFLIDSYKHLMDSNSIVLFVHRNNLVKQETSHFRESIKQLGGNIMVLKTSLFQVYLRNSGKPDPAARVKRSQQNWKHPLLPLFKGPTAAITFHETDPTPVAKLMRLLEKNQDKMFVVGAKVETEVYDVQKLNEFKNLPSKQELQSQLASVLGLLSGAGLVKSLESGSQTLYLTLKSHRDNI